MKKEVQALIRRRRARVIPGLLAGLAGLILIALIVMVVALFARGPALTFLRTETPTPSATASPRPSATRVPASPTPAETATPTLTPGPSPTPTQVVYVVQEGDNLFSIAAQFQANMCLIMAVNNLTDPSLLTVGQSLVIPPDDVELPTATPLPTGLPRGARVEYVVQCGDTLDTIAAKFNSTGDDIARTNDIDDPVAIQIGDTVIVRVNIATPTPTATSTVAQPTAATTGTATTAAP